MTVSTSCWGSLLKVECNNNHDYTEVKTVVKNCCFYLIFPFNFYFLLIVTTITHSLRSFVIVSTFKLKNVHYYIVNVIHDKCGCVYVIFLCVCVHVCVLLYQLI